ncbi:hypothetical protein [Porphyromonas cangingivalis]|nr:hypothetical protein [Porphyromonas cangingivalis]
MKEIKVMGESVIPIPPGYKAEVVDSSVIISSAIRAGDIVTISLGVWSHIGIFERINGERVCLSASVVRAEAGKAIIHDKDSSLPFDHIAIATNEEKEIFLRGLNALGYDWSPERRVLYRLAPRAGVGEVYYFINDRFSVSFAIEVMVYVDNERHMRGNYYLNKGECEAQAKELYDKFINQVRYKDDDRGKGGC